MIACFKELKDPIGRQASRFIVDLGNDRGIARVIIDSKESTQPGCRPQPPFMVFQKIMNYVIRQAIAFSVMIDVTVNSSAKQTDGRANPQ